MQQCVFCKSETAPFTTREHILPESLGGGDWALLREGLFCDHCQNRFGSEIEQQALSDYPFSFFRVFLGIPTKKHKAPWLRSWEGTVQAAMKAGQFGYDPARCFEHAMSEGRKTEIRLLAHPLRPHMICRTLLKMGIEVVANDSPTDVFHERYDAAREYALEGRKQGNWWYLQREDMQAASRFITQGVSWDDWKKGVVLSVTEIEDNAEMFHLRLLYMDLIVPLHPRIQAPLPTDLREPEFRLFNIE
ncbi:HNH endonuclease [Nitrosovibrio tenuis]|uniref:HNH endonuclease n=1 Tax=Nitrosovibrio tenuis TaxID=1233 RepID=A0A1H7LHH2_9PROT|nr:HNH endonuclease [Nitrosovibrio tenuis]SEK98391.1 HNH endonuclease [Nitrosovibrio tenuis]